MASRKITPFLFTGGMDTLEDGGIDVIRPKIILSVHPYPGKRYGNYQVVESFIRHTDVPTRQQLQGWIDTGSTALQNLERVLVMCNDGSQRSCSVAAVILAASQARPFTKVVRELTVLFQTPEQGMHVWFPYAHWYRAIVKQWSFLKFPAARPLPKQLKQ